MRNNVDIRRAKKIQLFPAYLITKDGKKWGYINNIGKFILKPQYDEAGDFQENGLAIVSAKGKAGMINHSGRYVIAPKYNYMMPFTEGRSIVMDDVGYKVINERGEEITKKTYDLIRPYVESRAIFGGLNSEGQYLYGYLCEQGNEVIPLQFENAYDFIGGKALVQTKENQYALITRTGEILQTYPYAFMMGYSEGLIPFQKTFNDKWGYVDEGGHIVISPQYSNAMAFQDGRAVVNIADDMYNKYGLINIKAEFIIPAEYNDIIQLGEKRVAIGTALNPKEPYIGSKLGIADTDGRILTDFLYDHVGEYKKGVSSVSQDMVSLFIDLTGRKANQLPTIQGIGTLELEGEIIQAHVDQSLSYYDLSGRTVYQPNTSFPLDEQYRIRIGKYRPNKDYLVYYPQVEGMNDQAAQKRVNTVLLNKSQVKYIPQNVQLDYSYDGNFSVEFYKNNLLVLKLEGYNYPFGAAHGMPYQTYVHIDLKTGKIYELEDLFKANSDYVNVLSDIIEKQINDEAEKGFTYYFPDQYKGIQHDQPFYITEDGLAIYFQPYEIAAYAAGFPTFIIPYDKIIDLIDIDGPFWQSFNK
ncbi:WG repeat-containing protein [Anaerobacillus sp. MEB173]|uniref:WG repeat-containing protein n=1 Tax=Anaerobacillus sp. MEB173 TaxID=3383345 RepID=UPI003F9018CF